MTTIKKNVPALRFSGFSGEWLNCKIQDLIDRGFITGHLDGNHGELYPRSEEFAKEGVPYISANDFIRGVVDFSRCKRLPENRAKKFKKGIAINDDVLFAHNATVGPTAILKTDLDFVILSTTATYFRCDQNKISNQYLRFFFQSDKFVRQCYRVKFQSTRSQVPITAQRKFDICTPSLPEQKIIASFLTSVDTKIEQLGKKKSLLEKYKKGMMQKIFSQMLRFKPEGNGKAREGSLGCYPDWEEERLGDISDVRDGTHDTPKYVKDGYPLITSKNLLKNGKLSFDDISHISKEDYAEINKRSNVNVGDIIFGMIGTIGNPVQVESSDFAIKNVALLKQKQMLLNKYLIHFLDSSNIKKQFHRQNAGGTQKFIALGVIRGLVVSRPCLDEQQEIANFLSTLDQKIDLIAIELKQAQTFKKGLLQQMFV